MLDVKHILKALLDLDLAHGKTTLQMFWMEVCSLWMQLQAGLMKKFYRALEGSIGQHYIERDILSIYHPK